MTQLEVDTDRTVRDDRREDNVSAFTERQQELAEEINVRALTTVLSMGKNRVKHV